MGDRPNDRYAVCCLKVYPHLKAWEGVGSLGGKNREATDGNIPPPSKGIFYAIVEPSEPLKGPKLA
jgi:hypothetical protein